MKWLENTKEGISEFEYDTFISTIKGPCCIKVWDGDYDYAIVFPDGLSVNAERYHPDVTLDFIHKIESAELKDLR